MTMKKCTKCGIEKLRTSEFFPKAKSCVDGLTGDCKACKADYLKGYQKANKKKLKEYHRIYHEDYKVVNKDLILERGKNYRKNNKDAVLERSTNWRLNNELYMKSYLKRWWRENRNASVQYSEKRRSLELGLVSTLTVEEWEWTLKHFDDSCCYCGKRSKLSQDHLIPVTKGGGYTLDNIIPACKSCNSSKHNKDFEHWYPSHKSYDAEREIKILNFISQQEIKEMEVN